MAAITFGPDVHFTPSTTDEQVDIDRDFPPETAEFARQMVETVVENIKAFESADEEGPKSSTVLSVAGDEFITKPDLVEAFWQTARHAEGAEALGRAGGSLAPVGEGLVDDVRRQAYLPYSGGLMLLTERRIRGKDFNDPPEPVYTLEVKRHIPLLSVDSRF